MTAKSTVNEQNVTKSNPKLWQLPESDPKITKKTLKISRNEETQEVDMVSGEDVSLDGFRKW